MAATALSALDALRRAIISGKDVHTEGSDLVIDGVAYPGSTQTAFRAKSGNFLTLIAIWTFYALRTLPYPEYMHRAVSSKVPLVLITDKTTVIDYLEGRTDAADRIDASGAAGAAVAASAAGGAVAAPGSAPEPSALEMVLSRELPFRTRASVLEADGERNLKEDVFKHFAAAAAGHGAGSKRGNAAARAGAGAGAEEAKRARPGAAAPAVPAAVAPGGAPADPFAGFRGTPIIIVPPGTSSLICMYNAQQLLEGGTFVDPGAACAAYRGDKPTKLTLRRTDSRGVATQFYVIDNPLLLQRHDWLKVVAVFAGGPDWQFKGWKWGRVEKDPVTGLEREAEDYPPVKIFSKALGFHLHFEGDAPHPNTVKWAVTLLPISKSQRFRDASVVTRFWAAVENELYVRKPYLLPKGAPQGPGAGAAAGGAAGGGALPVAAGGAGRR